MGDDYRAMMRRHFDYQASDFDLGAHVADIQIDLQAIALPDASLDVLLTPHVLEHIPDTSSALAEIYRVLAPGGRMYLQVPLVRGTTAASSTPEYHNDNTLVCWNFGWDLTGMLRAAGFATTVLVTADFVRMVEEEKDLPAHVGGVFNIADIVRDAPVADMTIVASTEEANAMGWLPSYQFATWECIRTA